MVFNQPGPLKSPYPLSPRCVGDDMHHVTDGIWIGSHYVLKSSNPLVTRNIRNVINTAIEFVTENPELINWEELQQYGIEVHNTLWDDTLQQVIFPSPSLEAAVKKMDEVLSSGQPILVNCAMGKSRSSTLIIAYLMARKGIGYDEALTLIKKSRPQCQPNANFERQMRQLEQCLRANTPQTNGTSNALVPAARPASVPNPVHQNNNNTNSPFSYLSKYNSTYSPSATYSRSLSPPGGRAQPNGFTSPHRAPLSPRASGAGPASPSPAQPSPHTSLGTHNHPLHNNHNYNKYLNNYPGAPNYSPAHTAYPSPNHNHANGPHATHTNGMGSHGNATHGHPHASFPSPGHGPSAYASPPHAPFGSPGHNNRHNAHGHNYNSPAHNAANNNNANNNNNRPNYSPYGNHFNPHSPYGGFGGGYGNNYGFGGNHGHSYGNRFSPGNHAMRRLSL